MFRNRSRLHGSTLDVEGSDEVLRERDRSLPYLVERVSRGVSSAASALYRERFGVGINEARVVISLARRPRVIAAVLVEDTALDKSTISRTLNVLLAGRLARYVEVSGRREFTLTRTGRSLYSRISGADLRPEELMLQGFTPSERATLSEYLQRLMRNIPRAHRGDPLSKHVGKKA